MCAAVSVTRRRALPAGTVRFYQRDRKGSPQFIGENGIGHTPMGSELSLRTGDAFDIFVQAEVEKREEITAAEWEKSVRYRVIRDGEVVEQLSQMVRMILVGARALDQRPGAHGRRRAVAGHLKLGA